MIALFVRRTLDRIFDFRRDAIIRLLEGPKPPRAPPEEAPSRTVG
jgi:hypothetical protein